MRVQKNIPEKFFGLLSFKSNFKLLFIFNFLISIFIFDLVKAESDNTTFNAITLTDEGYVTGSSGTKIFTGSTPLTGTASPQVQVRWKVVGSNQTAVNKIHGVSLQWG